MKPRDGTMLGMSRTTRRDSTIEFEFVRIEERDKRLHYVASPSGQAGATFSSIALTDSTVVFANPRHDFPQRVLYTLRGDSLLARIEGTRKGSVRGVDFPMQKVFLLAALTGSPNGRIAPWSAPPHSPRRC